MDMKEYLFEIVLDFNQKFGQSHLSQDERKLISKQLAEVYWDRYIKGETIPLCYYEKLEEYKTKTKMSDTKPGFVEKRLQLQRKHIEKLADDAYEGCDGCKEFEEKMWKDGFIRGYYAAEIELNQKQR